MANAELAQDQNHWGGGSRPLGARYGKLMMWFFLLSDALTFSGFLTAYGLMRFKYESTWPIAENVFTHFPGLEGDQPLLYVALMTFILIMSSVTMVLAVNAGEKMNRSAVTNWMLWTIVGGFIFVGSQAWEWYHFISGDSGAVETARQEILHVYNSEGERMSFSQLVHGMEEGHASNHGETFSKQEVLSSLKANKGYYLQEPGKAGMAFDHAESIALLEDGNVVQGANMIHNEYGRKQFANFFFFITGFHGFHVIVGTIFLAVCLWRGKLGHFNKDHHFGFEAAAWYWHFVDVVWLFLFAAIYIWGS